MIRGHAAYYAVPGDLKAVSGFKAQVTRHWFNALQRRSQRTRLTRTGMNRIAAQWLPPLQIMHPYPMQRFEP